MTPEMGLALERHRAGQAHVVPIIIEPCDWKSTPLRQLKAIPKDGEPIAKWENANEAYLDVVNELRRITTRRNTRHGLDAVVAEAIGRQFGQIHQRNMPRGAGTTRIQRMDPRGREQQASEAEPQVPAKAMGRPSAGGKYRIKQDFDKIHRAEFREATYATIREHFEREIAELNSLGSIRARLTARSATSFSCTVVNRARNHGTAHITVHGGGENIGFGDISYSFSENGPPNSANGFFSIQADEYELYLQSMMSFGDERNRLKPSDVAEHLWKIFIEQAGISYTGY